MREQQERWRDLQERINVTIGAWRKENPEATLTEIEEVVDEQMAQVRKQVVQDVAQAGRTADITGLTEAERPHCPRCGEPMVANGKGKRKLKTEHGQTIELARHQAYCPECEVTFFPSG